MNLKKAAGGPYADFACEDFGDFSTVHSNGTNKVIDTSCILCYAFSCISSYNPVSLSFPV